VLDSIKKQVSATYVYAYA